MTFQIFLEADASSLDIFFPLLFRVKNNPVRDFPFSHESYILDNLHRRLDRVKKKETDI